MFDLPVIGPQPALDNFNWLLYIKKFTFVLTSLFAMTVLYDICITCQSHVQSSLHCPNRLPGHIQPGRDRGTAQIILMGLTDPIDNKTEITALPLGQTALFSNSFANI